MKAMEIRLLPRGHKFTGRHAERNRLLYELYRRGASASGLAKACHLSTVRVWQIIAEGKQPR